MEYGKPTKLQDGRYFLKISQGNGEKVIKQINNVIVQDDSCYKVSSADIFEAIDDEIISQAEKNSEEWFSKKFDRDTLKAAFDSSISAGILEAQFARKNTVVMTKVFDNSKNEVALDSLVPGTKCDILVELVGLWFIKKSFGPVWRVAQARLKKETKFIQQYMFEDEKSDDEYDV